MSKGIRQRNNKKQENLRVFRREWLYWYSFIYETRHWFKNC